MTIRNQGQLRLHFVVGATGVGKTAVATTLAESLNAPVLVMDRMQVYPELAIGTGRPVQAELRGTERVYLEERSAVQGDLPAPEAHRLLRQRVQELRRYHEDLILEGGSISLLSELCMSAHWLQYPKTVRHIVALGPVRYCARIRRRIERMIHPSGAGSVLMEVAATWRDVRTHGFLRSIVGYDAILAWCRRRLVPPTDLAAGLARKHLYEVGDEMLAGHLRYARLQAEAFERLVPRLVAMGAQPVRDQNTTRERSR